MAECAAVSIAGEIGRVGVAGGGSAAVTFLVRTALETALGKAEQLAQISDEPGAVRDRQIWCYTRLQITHEAKDGSPILTLQPGQSRSLMLRFNKHTTETVKIRIKIKLKLN